MMSQIEKRAVGIARRAGAPAGWMPFIFIGVVGGIICTGAVCPLITRGKGKGRPNYQQRLLCVGSFYNTTII